MQLLILEVTTLIRVLFTQFDQIRQRDTVFDYCRDNMEREYTVLMF